MFDFFLDIGVPKQYVGDVWVLIALIVASLFLVILFKKQNLGSLIASVYCAYAIETKIFFDWFSGSTMRFGVLIILLLLLFFVFKKFFGEVASGSNMISEWIKISLVSITIVGFVTSIVMDWYSRAVLGGFFSAFSMSIFRSDEAQLVWMLAPIGVIYIVNL